MRTTRRLSLATLVAGLLALAYAGVQGQLSVHLVVVVPVVTSSSPWAALGMLLVMGGLVGWFLTGHGPLEPGSGSPPGGPRAKATAAGTGPEEGHDERASRSGGVVLIGPLPIAWGSDAESLRWVLVLAILLALVVLGGLYLLRA